MKRLRIFTAFMVIFLVSGCVNNYQNIKPYSQEIISIQNHGMIVYDKIKDSVVLIGSEYRPNGSGYFIGQNQIVTCYHVVDGLEKVFLQFHDDEGKDRTYELEIIGVSPVLDIALLKFKTPPQRIIKPLKFRTDPVMIGQDVYLYGHPMMNMYYFSTGVVSKLVDSFQLPYTEDLTLDYKAIYTDAFMGPGSSGGVMVDSNGDIMGMTSAAHIRYGIPIGMNIAIHVDELSTTTAAIMENPELYPMPVEPEPEPEPELEDEYYDDEEEEDIEEDKGDTEEEEEKDEEDEVLDKDSEEYKKAREKAIDEALERAEEKAKSND